MPKPIPDRIAALKAKKEALNARLNTLQAKAKTDERKRDTRRKIVVGGAVLAYLEKDAAFKRLITGILAQAVGRAIDREAIADLLQPSPVGPGASGAAPPSPPPTTRSYGLVEDLCSTPGAHHRR